MNYQAIIKEIPEYIIYCHQTVIPSYDDYNQVIPALGQKVASRYPNLKCVNPGYCFVRYLENEYKETDIKIEFCEAVDQLKDDFDDIHFRRIPPATVVSVLHRGPYTSPDGGIGQAYAYAFRWIEENGYELSDSPRESYIDGIWNKDDPANWLTELQFPVRKKACAR